MIGFTQGDSMLAVATTALFAVGFVGMATGFLYFLLIRPDIKSEHRSVPIYAALITFVASLLYLTMVLTVNAGGVSGTMPLRYIDWVITTPLLLLEFGVVAGMAGGVKKGLISRLIVADLIMIITGYLGEISSPGDAATYVWFIISVLAWIWIIVEVFGVKASGDSYAAKAVSTMKWFVIIGWSIYPLGTAIQQFMSLGQPDDRTLMTAAEIAAIVYIVADLVNKVVFGIVAVNAAKKS